MTTKITQEDAVHAFETQARMAMERGEKAAAEFKTAVDQHGLVYALEWARSYAKAAAEADLWRTVRHHRLNDMTPAEAIQVVLDEVTKELLNNWVRRSSTDPFSNAMGDAKAEAYASFRNEATSVLYFMAKAE